jgi:hypothetical protein
MTANKGLEKCERISQLGRPRNRWKNNIKINLKEMGWKGG